MTFGPTASFDACVVGAIGPADGPATPGIFVRNLKNHLECIQIRFKEMRQSEWARTQRSLSRAVAMHPKPT